MEESKISEVKIPFDITHMKIESKDDKNA